MFTPEFRQQARDQLRHDYDESPIKNKLSAAAALSAAGLIFVYLATEGAGIVIGLIGFVTLAAGLYPIKDLIREPSHASDTRWRWLGAGLAAIVVGSVLVWIALRTDQAWFAALGTLIVVLGLLPASSYQRIDTKRVGRPVTLIGLAVVVATVLLVAIPGVKLQWLLAATLILAAITVYRTGLTGWLTDKPSVAVGTKLGVVGVVAGTVLVCLGGQLVNKWLFVLGALPGTLALHLLSVASTSKPAQAWKKSNAAWQQWAPKAHIVAGIAVVVTWIIIWTYGQQPFWLGTGIAIALFSIGAAFVWRGESVLLVLLCGFVVVWATVDRSEPALATPEPGVPRIVAVGDSYMSGEGAPTYFEHTNVAGDNKNECRRAPTAYPVLVAQALGVELQFLACSGAKAHELWQDAQMEDASDDAPGNLPQIDNITSLAGVQMVLVSIGGNDASFSTVGTGCLLPGSCDDLADVWIKNAEGLSVEMVPAFEKIREKVGPDIPIIAMPYPIMVRERGCSDVMLTSSEHEFVVRFVETINAQAELSAARAGIHFFQGGADAFVGDKLCSQEELAPASVNFIGLQPPKGPLIDRINPANWVHQSLHPNPTGHGRTAAALVSWLKSSPPGANPQPNPNATLQDLGIDLAPAPPADLALLPDEDEWRNQQLSRAAREAWPIVVVLFLGGWAFAFTSKGGGPFSRKQ